MEVGLSNSWNWSTVRVEKTFVFRVDTAQGEIFNRAIMGAFVFDLGDTLVEYEGLPLSWVDHYPEAIHRLASFMGVVPTADQVNAACTVLRGYNTRLHPRQSEVSFSLILDDVRKCFAVEPVKRTLEAAHAFFSVFRQRLRCFSDSQATLTSLKQRGAKLAIFTDVPYGMPRSLVLEDVLQVGLVPFFDLIVTSEEVGCRKPAPSTLEYIAVRLRFGPRDVTYVGNERKDVEAAKAFGCTAVLLDRNHLSPDWGQDRTICSLAQLLVL